MAGPDGQCKQCGTCCRKGGPILHHADLSIIALGYIPHENLITIRKGEPVLHPLRSEPERAGHEMIKLSGQGSDWVCQFFNPNDNSCGIYANRPLECQLLKCWDTGALEEIIGRDTIGRSDIISHDHPATQLILMHDKECSWNSCLEYATALADNPTHGESMTSLTTLVRQDLTIRYRAVSQLNLSVELELFYFGRPLFTILHAYGLDVYEHGTDIHLRPSHQVL